MDALRWKRPLWLIIPILLIVAIVGGALLLRGNGLLLRNPPVGGPGGTVAGVLPGDFEVSTNGDATYSIPIEVPPGINEIEPNLSLIYSSHGGSGRLGVGWELQGLSAITRCDATLAVDGFRGTISYGHTDRYCLDGQRLINVNGTYSGAESVYRTELETWRTITASSTLCGTAPARSPSSISWATPRITAPAPTARSRR